MKVDGAFFKTTRERVRARSPGRGTRENPAKGTQQWLANQAKIAVRSVINLEKGEASSETLEAVSKVLKISNWEKYIIDYGQKYVTCSADKYIDFRPQLSPKKYPDRFMNSIMLMSIDPLYILVDSGGFDSFLLEDIKVSLHGLGKIILFSWYAEVSLTEGMNGWLGWVKDMEAIELQATDKPLNIPVMFKQDNIRVSWQEFIKMVEDSGTSKLTVKVKLEFARFAKQFDIYVCTHCLRDLFEQGRQKHQSIWPHRAQLRTIPVD